MENLFMSLKPATNPATNPVACQDDRRPVSPHLQVYDLPLAAKLSIFHRATGLILFIGMLMMVAVLLASTSANSWNTMHSLLSSMPGKLVLFGLTFSLYYHFCTGIRHLLWDMGMGFSLTQTDLSNRIILIVSVVLTLMTWLIAGLIS
jgi:succinate dehydrogenase / fumarate reductase cytochrome b subunit